MGVVRRIKHPVEVGEDYMNPDDTVDEDTDGEEVYATADEYEEVTPVTNKTAKRKKGASGYWIWYTYFTISGHYTLRIVWLK